MLAFFNFDGQPPGPSEGWRFGVCQKNEVKKMKKRWIEVARDADEKQEARFEAWVSGTGVPVVSSEAEEAYKIVRKYNGFQ